MRSPGTANATGSQLWNGKVAADVPAVALSEAGSGSENAFARDGERHRKAVMKGSLSHKTPGWVPSGALFHVRLRADRENRTPLIYPELASSVLDAARHYHVESRWQLRLMVLMPDHLHMIACFSLDPGMSRTMACWKAYLSRKHDVRWQSNYFDHRLRSVDEYAEKAHYIRMNPVRAGLCCRMEDWKWVLDGESLSAALP